MIEVFRRDERPWRIGHRGAAALAPGNTLAALERAVAEGVDVVEFDVLDLEDGTLVLAHSDDLLDVSGGRTHGRLRHRSLAELRGTVPGLPTLDEALAFLAGHAPEAGVHVDLKWPGYELAVVEAVRRHGLVGRTLVSSFFHESLGAIREAEPGLRLGLAYPFDRHGLSRRRPLAPFVGAGVLAMRQALPARIGPWIDRTGATVAALQWLVVSRSVIARCHARGVAVWAWTVDSRRMTARLAAAGVDGIITNDPRIFADTLTP
jgi:glycerophosphoryl diester phosphodiesterase